PVNLTKHTVLHNGAETAQTSSQGAELRPGQTLHGYAMFAAPPEDVTAMDVMLVAGATPATGVEIRCGAPDVSPSPPPSCSAAPSPPPSPRMTCYLWSAASSSSRRGSSRSRGRS